MLGRYNLAYLFLFKDIACSYLLILSRLSDFMTCS